MNKFKNLFEKQEKKKKKKEEMLKPDFESDKGTAEGVVEKKDKKVDEAVVFDVEEFKNFIAFMFGNIAQFHIYHLLTKNGTHHEALGVLYNGLRGELDSICEQVLAGSNLEGGEEDEYGVEIEFYYDHEDCVEDIKEVSSYASDMIRSLASVENVGLVSELTEIKELCDKSLYKMNLS